MSTDSSARKRAPTGRPEPTPSTPLRRYRVALRCTFGALIVVVTSLTVATAAQGPRVTDVQVSAEGVLQRDGARLRLHLDRAVDPAAAGRVAISPAAGLEASAVGNEITITFTELLRYNTEYTVTVEGAESTTSPSVSASFTTAAPEITSLAQTARDGRFDRLQSQRLDGGNITTITSDAGALSYAVSGSWIALLSQSENGDQHVQTINRTDGTRRLIDLPPGARITHLHGATSSARFGFVVTTPDGSYDRALFTLDLSAPSTDGTDIDAVPIVDAGGGAFATADWAFQPGSTTIAALGVDATLRRIAADTVELAPLGAQARLGGFVPGTADLLIIDADSASVVDVQTGETSAVDLPRDLTTAGSPETPTLLDAATYLRLATAASATGVYDAGSIVIFDGYGERELYRPAEHTSIRSRCLSPNGQYLAVVIEPTDESVTDEQLAPGLRTVLVDIDTGDATRIIDGLSLDWC